tara:strand:+ start:112 stop:309 length:198 start_codon:yes stop_codon:yes gene_type:complete
MLLEEIQFGLSGQSINCPMEPGLDPEQPINNINKNKSNIHVHDNNFSLDFRIFMFVVKSSIRNAL